MIYNINKYIPTGPILWYSTRENGKSNSQAVYYDTIPKNIISGTTIRSLYSDPDSPLGFVPLGNNYNITYTCCRTPTNNLNSAITFSSCFETFNINTPFGSVSGSTVYYDKGSGIDTSVDKNIYNITGGTGNFRESVIAIITYDNSGEKFGYPFSRKIEFFRLKN